MSTVERGKKERRIVIFNKDFMVIGVNGHYDVKVEGMEEGFRVVNVNELSPEKQSSWNELRIQRTGRPVPVFQAFSNVISMVQEDIGRGIDIGDVEYGVERLENGCAVLSTNRDEIYSAFE